MTRHLTTRELAKRWQRGMSTLEYWRIKGIGPAYIKIGGRVLYRIKDIEAFEDDHKLDGVGNRTEGPRP